MFLEYLMALDIGYESFLCYADGVSLCITVLSDVIQLRVRYKCIIYG